jgi:hypothetical protein
LRRAFRLVCHAIKLKEFPRRVQRGVIAVSFELR